MHDRKGFANDLSNLDKILTLVFKKFEVTCSESYIIAILDRFYWIGRGEIRHVSGWVLGCNWNKGDENWFHVITEIQVIVLFVNWVFRREKISKLIQNKFRSSTPLHKILSPLMKLKELFGLFNIVFFSHKEVHPMSRRNSWINLSPMIIPHNRDQFDFFLITSAMNFHSCATWTEILSNLLHLTCFINMYQESLK